jgi:glycosyltransferase involved in cell wall biosynthesis
VTDSRRVQEYYRTKHHAETTYIAYGSDVVPLPPGEYMQRFNLEPQKYVLFVGRLVPENCVHHLVSAFEHLQTDMKCVIVGDAPYAADYIQTLKTKAGPNVVFTGYVYGEGYRELSSHAYAFVETSEVGGTHPALLEAMAFGNVVIVNDTRENVETIGDAGLTYRGQIGGDDLAHVLQTTLDNPALAKELGCRARERVHQQFSWDAVTDEYERLFQKMLGHKKQKSVSQ